MQQMNSMQFNCNLPHKAEKVWCVFMLRLIILRSAVSFFFKKERKKLHKNISFLTNASCILRVQLISMKTSSLNDMM